MYAIRLVFNPNYTTKRPGVRLNFDEFDRANLIYEWGASFFDCMLDYMTGEIYLQKGLPLSRILSRSDYLKLKNLIFDGILECIAYQKEQLSKTPQEGVPIVSATIGDVQEQIAETLPDPDTAPASRPLTSRKRSDIDPNDNRYLQMLAGKLNFRRICRALVAILGEPRNNGSSHFIFTSRDGKTQRPLASHKGNVRFRLIKRVLN